MSQDLFLSSVALIFTKVIADHDQSGLFSDHISSLEDDGSPAILPVFNDALDSS